jgi:hypothetical protein
MLESPSVRAACLIHHADGLADIRNVSMPLAITGQITYVGLSPHVSDFVKRELQNWAKFDREPMWNNVDVKTIIPVSIARGVSLGNAGTLLHSLTAASNADLSHTEFTRLDDRTIAVQSMGRAG